MGEATKPLTRGEGVLSSMRFFGCDALPTKPRSTSGRLLEPVDARETGPMRVRMRVWLAGLALLAGVAALTLLAPARETDAQEPTPPIAFSHAPHAGQYTV